MKIEEIVEKFVKETGRYEYASFMNWLYMTDWNTGLNILDDHLYQNEVKKLLSKWKQQ